METVLKLFRILKQISEIYIKKTFEMEKNIYFLRIYYCIKYIIVLGKFY